MIENHTSTIIPEINKIVSPDFCKKLAKSTGFVKRSTSRLKGDEFVKVMILGQGDDSLLTYTRRIKKLSPKTKISLVGLAQRINRESSEILMYEVMVKCLVNSYEKGINKIEGISRILIQDSTCIALNKKLGNIYAGSGGHHKTAGVKIDCIYDYTNENILSSNHYARTVSDTKNSKEIFKHIKTNDLIIRDLGYFIIDDLETIEKCNAFFLSRLKINVKVYLRFKDKEPLDLIQFLKKKLKNQNTLDCTAYIGVNKLKIRLVVAKLPEEVVNERLRKANRSAQVARKPLSDEKKAFLKYSIFITNLPDNIASLTDILNLYRIRWRIELLFKEWKSQIHIENILGTNIHRIRCLIYGRICLVLILNKIISYLSYMCLKLYQRELCVKRVLDILIKDGVLIELFTSKNTQKKLKEILEGDDLSVLLKNKRKNRKTTRELVIKA